MLHNACPETLQKAFVGKFGSQVGHDDDWLLEILQYLVEFVLDLNILLGLLNELIDKAHMHLNDYIAHGVNKSWAKDA